MGSVPQDQEVGEVLGPVGLGVCVCMPPSELLWQFVVLFSGGGADQLRKQMLLKLVWFPIAAASEDTNLVV